MVLWTLLERGRRRLLSSAARTKTSCSQSEMCRDCLNVVKTLQLFVYLTELSLLFHSRTPVPVMVTELIRDNDEEGQPEKTIPKNATYHLYVSQSVCWFGSPLTIPPSLIPALSHTLPSSHTANNKTISSSLLTSIPSLLASLHFYCNTYTRLEAGNP